MKSSFSHRQRRSLYCHNDAARSWNQDGSRCWLVRIRRIALAVIVNLTLSSIAVAQPSKPGTANQTGVDVVTLKTGRTLRGTVFKADPNGDITLIASREWLQQGHPELFGKVVSQDAETRKAAAEQLRSRLKKRLEVPLNEPELQVFLKQELERIENVLAEEQPAEVEQFVWVDIPHETVSKVSRAPVDRRKIAQWGWSERLPKVETRDTHDLERELKKRGVDVTLSAPDLSDRLPARQQDDREWGARMALVEYSLTKPLDFQGTADVLVRSDTDRKALDLAHVLNRVLQSQVDSLLKDLTGGAVGNVAKPGDWLKSATREADGLAAHGLRATRVDVKVDGNQVVVETAFAVRLPMGNWETIWSHREVQDATKVRPDAEERIAGDPQVKIVLDTVKSLGLAADDQVRQAIRFGAATMAAQQAADSNFYEFRDRYLNRLDRPPLSWSR